MQEVRLTVRVKPGASRARVGGAYGDQGALVVSVNAPPVDGRANDAVCSALADALDVRPRDVTVASGHTARTKIVVVSCAAADVGVINDRITQLLAQ